MQIQKETKLFAFKLAEKKDQDAKPAAQWQVRDGVSIAGCTTSVDPQNPRGSRDLGIDNGVWC